MWYDRISSNDESHAATVRVQYPDAEPLREGLWLATGFNVGIGTGGGSAEFLAHWMVDGAPHFDLDAVHADRFGNDMTRDEALAAIRQVYARGYRLPDSI